jgi:hypothetical protein
MLLMVFFLVVLSLLMLLMVFLKPPLVLFVSLVAIFGESNLSTFFFCCVTNGLLPNGLDLFGVLPCVHEPTLVLLLSLVPFLDIQIPPIIFFIVLVMVFFMFLSLLTRSQALS